MIWAIIIRDSKESTTVIAQLIIEIIRYNALHTLTHKYPTDPCRVPRATRWTSQSALFIFGGSLPSAPHLWGRQSYDAVLCEGHLQMKEREREQRGWMLARRWSWSKYLLRVSHPRNEMSFLRVLCFGGCEVKSSRIKGGALGYWRVTCVRRGERERFSI